MTIPVGKLHWILPAVVLCLAGCGRACSSTVRPPSWPELRLDDVDHITVTAGPQQAVVARDAQGVWRMLAPHVGEADLQAVTRLMLSLRSPPCVPGPAGAAPVRTTVLLHHSDGSSRKVSIHVAPLGASIPVTLDDGTAFLVSPVEFSNKIPFPDDFAPAALWPSAEPRAASLTVEGPLNYRLKGRAETWEMTPPREDLHVELDDVVGVLTGRQVLAFPKLPLAALGLEPPLARATLCIPERCQTFALGMVDGHAYAKGPETAPVEIHQEGFRLLVHLATR